MATTNIDSTRNFIDLDLNFMIHPIRKDINTHKAEYAVINSVKNLILTNHFERPFQPEVGSNLNSLLFEPVSPITANALEIEIRNVLNNFEPRAQIDEIVVDPLPDQNAFYVRVTFFIGNATQPTAVNLLLERNR
jgi:phage baseplate assembly protein W